MTVLRLMASRHSAFYSPLLGAIAAGFLKDEGFDPVYTPLPPGKTVAQLLTAGEIDVAQSAVSASWGALEQGQQPPTVHFAQINERDGFLIAARRPDPAFSWDKLRSGGFMFVHGGQPQAMLAYAMHKRGVDLKQVRPVNAGASESMMAAWRQGQGDYFHEQGPYPQQLEHEQIAHTAPSTSHDEPCAAKTPAGTLTCTRRRQAPAYCNEPIPAPAHARPDQRVPRAQPSSSRLAACPRAQL
jgi:NitT/TauT family transport system substrate-binding protein